MNNSFAGAAMANGPVPYQFSPWVEVITLIPVHNTVEETGRDIVCRPTIKCTTYSGDVFHVRGSIRLDRFEQTAKFSVLVRGHQVLNTEEDGMTFVHSELKEWRLNLTSRHQWTISERKVKGAHVKAREFTLEFDGENADANDIQSIVAIVPITLLSDQAAIFSYALDWCSKLVDANIAYINLYAAVHANQVNQAVDAARANSHTSTVIGTPE